MVVRQRLASGSGLSRCLARCSEVVELCSRLGGLILDILSDGACRKSNNRVS